MKKKLLMMLALGLVLGLCACGNSGNAGTGNEENQNVQDGGENEELEFETIELTIDNWQEYFEIKDIVKVYRDEFDEITSAMVINQYVCVKEEYLEYWTGMDFVFEWDVVEDASLETRPWNTYLCTYNVETGEFKKELIGTEENIDFFPKTISTEKVKKSILDNTKVPMFNGTYGETEETSIDGNIITWKQSMDPEPIMLRFKGTLELIKK